MSENLSYHYCTYFDRNYLTRGLALYYSLARCSQNPFTLWILCFDSETCEILERLQLPSVHLISQSEFEAGDEPLVNAKSNRSRVEYYWTCTPSLPLYIFKRTSVDLITYLDADLYFYADPAPLYTEIGYHSIAIIGHRFPPKQRHLEQNGIYNVGWLSFRSDAESLACLELWRSQCIEWCYARLEDGRYGDQKYLDDWTRLYKNLIILQHKGANLAAWNIVNYRIRRVNDQLWVDQDRLIFFHFHGLEKIKSWLYAPNTFKSRIPTTSAILRGIYQPYIRELETLARKTYEMAASYPVANSVSTPKTTLPSLVRRGNYRLDLLKKILRREIVFYLNGRVI